MKVAVFSFISKIVLYVLLFGGIKVLELDKFIISLTNLLNAIAGAI